MFCVCACVLCFVLRDHAFVQRLHHITHCIVLNESSYALVDPLGEGLDSPACLCSCGEKGDPPCDLGLGDNLALWSGDALTLCDFLIRLD